MHKPENLGGEYFTRALLGTVAFPLRIATANRKYRQGSSLFDRYEQDIRTEGLEEKATEGMTIGFLTGLVLHAGNLIYDGIEVARGDYKPVIITGSVFVVSNLISLAYEGCKSLVNRGRNRLSAIVSQASGMD